MTSRHPNDQVTGSRRVLQCVKCGDRHTVDVAGVRREAITEVLSLVKSHVLPIGEDVRHSIGYEAARACIEQDVAALLVDGG